MADVILTDRDKRLELFIQAIEQLKHGEYELSLPVSRSDEIGKLSKSLQELANVLEQRYQEVLKLNTLTSHINSGLLLDDVLEKMFAEFQNFIPYDRIGFSLIVNNGRSVRARWAKSELPVMKLTGGYTASLEGSSLQQVLRTGRPRILNDLVAYLADKPGSESTALVVEEGVRSSLTCPLIANGVPIGFMFFSSQYPHAYDDAHIELFQSIAGQLAVIVEKGRLVSELADQKLAIEKQNEALRRLNEMKDAFLGMAAHDLRNPLGAIKMAIDLLWHIPMSDEDRESFMRDMDNQASHMLGLVEDLLDVSQIESGKLELNQTALQLDTVLQDAVKRHNQLATPKNTRVDLAETPAGQVYADPRRLRQVLDNLISNAVKYSPPGSTICLKAERIPDFWKVSVRDQGPGITPEDREKLFQDFARLSARPTGGEKSTGLGLAITRRVVEAHGGRIGVDSTPGQGATFWFTLPIP